MGFITDTIFDIFLVIVLLGAFYYFFVHIPLSDYKNGRKPLLIAFRDAFLTMAFYMVGYSILNRFYGDLIGLPIALEIVASIGTMMVIKVWVFPWVIFFLKQLIPKVKKDGFKIRSKSLASITKTIGGVVFFIVVNLVLIPLAWLIKFLSIKTIDAVSLLYKEIKLYKEYKESRKKDDEYTVTIIHPEELDEGKNRLNE